ncbi:mycothiol synthase [Prescottella subtropica]|uniref:mycothiol synthase n=1 Tax=Prescottella subtropica TaxID=2545757 RepID=UPI0010F75900|nr:mycothiol synthase [Prescottella subtropica]
MNTLQLDWIDSPPAAAIRDLVARATTADGTAPVSEQALHALTGTGSARHLTATVDGRVVGYAQLEPGHGDHPAMAEVVVDPDGRGAGTGRRLVAEALHAGGAGTRVWAHGNLPAAVAVADRLGLVGARELLQLRRSLTEPLPDVVVPDGVTLRTYRGPADDAEILRVNAAAFAWHPEQGTWTQHDVDERRSEPWFDPEGLFLAFPDTGDTERLLGFHWTKVHAPEHGNPALGEVYVVGIDPDAQGRGLGRVLTLAGLHHLRERGLGAVLLYVEGDNTAALHTYERLGFERFHVDVAYAAGV